MFCLSITSTCFLNICLSRKHSSAVIRNFLIRENIIWNEIMHKEQGAQQICSHLLLGLVFSSLQTIIWSAQCLTNRRPPINDSLLFPNPSPKLEQGEHLGWSEYFFFMAHLQFWRQWVPQVTHHFRTTHLSNALRRVICLEWVPGTIFAQGFHGSPLLDRCGTRVLGDF